jgi:hypothetical protein
MSPTTNTSPNARLLSVSPRQQLERELLSLEGEQLVIEDRLKWIALKRDELLTAIHTLDHLGG